MKKALLNMVLLASLAACSNVELPQRNWEGKGDPSRYWASVLSSRVDAAGRVDFAGLAQNPEPLLVYLNYVAEISPRSHPARFANGQVALAYYINAYNALAMYNVIDSGIPASLGGVRKVHFFYLKRLKVGGERISLYALENDIIRAMGEPRVHFALNCMSVSCPQLPRRPFSAQKLDDELEREATRFFARRENLDRDPQRKTVQVSRILKFFTEDFTGDGGSLIDYMNRYLEDPVPRDFTVGFFPYDWSVNAQPPAR